MDPFERNNIRETPIDTTGHEMCANIEKPINYYSVLYELSKKIKRKNPIQYSAQYYRYYSSHIPSIMWWKITPNRFSSALYDLGFRIVCMRS